MTNKYNELTKLFVEQENRVTEWRNAIRGAIIDVRNHFISSFDLGGKTWHEMGQSSSPKPYIALFTMDNEPFRHDLNDVITEDGSAFFKLSFIFELRENAHPKSDLRVPIAAQYYENKLRYGLVNTLDSSVDVWVPTLEDLEEKVIELLEGHFSFDPFEGFQSRKSIGFL